MEKYQRETKEGKVRRKRRNISVVVTRAREGKNATKEKVQECGRRETVCGAAGGRPSVHCKSPSTAFNYDVIANTDDGYFLRYTLYITRPYQAVARTKGRKVVVCTND